ncbi:MAG: YitT family protein [Bacteroides sp.]|nr:MAG: YitT family protein [Bacteroides sp.]
MYIPSDIIKKIEVKNITISTIYIILGVLSAGLGLKGFLIPNDFIDGGVTGISLLTSKLIGINVPILIFFINIPFIIMGYKQINAFFSIKTFIAILILSLTVHYIEFPIVTNDKLLISVFGGFFLGSGIGLAIRGGCVIDGTEILAIYINRKSVFSIGDIILLINITIFSVAASVLGLETALYSILTYLSASKTIDFVIHGIEEYIGVTVITVDSHQIKNAITQTMERGVTIYKGKRGFENNLYDSGDIDILFTIITRLELSRLKSLINEIDDKAFVVIHKVDDANGGMIKKKAF